MIAWSIDALAAVDEIERIVVALPPGVHAPAGTLGVPGGETRSASVRAALHAAGDTDVVVVHDAARPLTTPALVRDCLDTLAAHDCDAAIAAAPVTDTIKESRGEEVVRTLDRSALWAVQTPQAFTRDALERALDCSRRGARRRHRRRLARRGRRRDRAARARPAREPQGHHAARPARRRAAARRAHARLTSPRGPRAHRPPRPPAPRRHRRDARRAVLHARERRALPRGGVRARDRGARRQRARLPLHPGARRLAARAVARVRARRPRRLLRVRARGDRPQARHRGRLHPRPRGPHGRAARGPRLGLRHRLDPLPRRPRAGLRPLRRVDDAASRPTASGGATSSGSARRR